MSAAAVRAMEEGSAPAAERTVLPRAFRRTARENGVELSVAMDLLDADLTLLISLPDEVGDATRPCCTAGRARSRRRAPRGSRSPGSASARSSDGTCRSARGAEIIAAAIVGRIPT